MGALPQQSKRCHGLVPWNLTFVASPESRAMAADATGSHRGASRLLLLSWEREPPRRKAVASSLRIKKESV
jgi:hypothetical protein